MEKIFTRELDDFRDLSKGKSDEASEQPISHLNKVDLRSLIYLFSHETLRFFKRFFFKARKCILGEEFSFLSGKFFLGQNSLVT